MGALHLPLRLRVTLTSVWSGFVPEAVVDAPPGVPEQPPKGTVTKVVIQTGEPAQLISKASGGGSSESTSFASGLVSGTVQESVGGGSTCQLTFLDFKNLVWLRSQDHVLVEAGLLEEDGWVAIFSGFVSDLSWQTTSTPEAITQTFTITATGIEKLFKQSIYNWQSVYTGGDIRDPRFWLNGEGLENYKKLCESAVAMPPQEVIKALCDLAFRFSVNLEVDGVPARPGGLFKFGTRYEWDAFWGATPVQSASVLYRDWQGTMWDLVQNLAEPIIHECFMAMRSGTPTLVFRPIPFPGEPDLPFWDRLLKGVWQMGKDGLPAAVGVNTRQSDANRANLFHWGWGNFTDSGAHNFAAKFAMGYYMDRRMLGRYGCAAEVVTTNLIPTMPKEDAKPEMGHDGTESPIETKIRQLLEHVGKRDAPRHLLYDVTLNYPVLAYWLEIGTLLEDWSTGSPMTGYIQTRTFAFEFDATSLHVSTNIGLTRAWPSEAKDYAEEVVALANVQRFAYSKTVDPKKVPMQAAAAGRVPDNEVQLPSDPPKPGPGDETRKPIAGAVVINSPFGKRIHPISGDLKDHLGVDLKAAIGTPVLAPIGGTVLATGDTGKKGFGKFVKLQASDGTIQTFAHLSSISVTANQVVTAGQQLGLSGASGSATGPHLHWAVTQNGKPINPLFWGRV